MSIAIIIAGTMCSGKSRISKKIQKELNIDLITELNVSPNNIFGMIYEIKSKENKSNILIEHLEILRVIDKIEEYFTKIIIILLNVSEDVLIKNFNERKLYNTIKYPFETVLDRKKYIKELFVELKNDYEKYIVDINTYDDYDLAYNYIMNILSKYINK